MSSSWLKDYMLEGLGSEIRKTSSFSNETTSVATTAEATTADQARLVQILGRGQDRSESATNRGSRGWNSDARRLSQGSDWWNPKRRGKSPNLSKHTNAWILVSDGSHSARLYLTVEALREVFDCDNGNSNEDNLFVRGCCILLKDYSFDYWVDNQSNENGNAKGNQKGQYIVPSVHLSVSSLEPKPGFNYHNEASKDNANRNGNNGETTVRPVTEGTDVLFGLQCLSRQRQQLVGDTSSIDMTSAEQIARDWDIAFGRLSKGRLTSSTMEEDTISLVDGKNELDDVLELAEQAASKDEAIREWESAKKDFGVVDVNGANDDETLDIAQEAGAKERKNDSGVDHIQNSQDEEDVSHMYIQNVLATPDDGESENENEDDNRTSGNEETELFETQPKILVAPTGDANGDPEKNSSNDDEDNEGSSITLLQTQPAEVEEKEPGEKIAESTTRMRRNRPRSNSFESASNLTLDEALSGPASTRKPSSHKRRRQQQRLMQQQQQRKIQKSAGIWESVKEQLFEPGRTLLYCVPSSQLPIVTHNKDDEKMLVTPKTSLTSPTGSARNLGSGTSVGTNLTSWTPNPSSGAYYRKYGLARWLSQNTADEA
eukprot:CAMPEP_0116136360 /NCGR_PEP_ID=MMETSP0329-20121206/11682_1 /TAXON_ID=697910 /ORGANISM="Pseudo-nitzschia arenysensis, Strain B593" /LENGTH=601 /DNA_ID=CAMNT_0003631221 /DNA_START=129 /DNA_END=1934 /DNA_ORIENTATION=+